MNNNKFNSTKYKQGWDKENLSTVIAKYNKTFVDEFKHSCKVLGLKQSEVFRKAMEDTIKSAKKDTN